VSEWYTGGGKLRYMNKNTGLGAAIRKHTGSIAWHAPQEDQAIFNFAVRLRSDAVMREAVADLAAHHMGANVAAKDGALRNLVVDLISNPEAWTESYAAERGLTPVDMIEAQRILQQMGLEKGSMQDLVQLDHGHDFSTAAFIQNALAEAKGYGLTDTSEITGIAGLDMVMRWWKVSTLGKFGFLSSPARFIADAMGAPFQAYLTRGGAAVGDIGKLALDGGAWNITAAMAEMRARKFKGTVQRVIGWNGQQVFVFPSGVYSGDELVQHFRQRGLDAQAARSENAAQLIDDVRRHDYGTFRRLVAVDDHVQIANEVSNMADMWFRTRVALGELQRGADIDTACAAAREALYDYSGLTPMERKLRGFFPWYTFTRRNTEAVLKAAIENPQRVAKLMRLADKQTDLWGWDDNRKELLRSGAWGSIIVGQSAGKDLHHDGKFYLVAGVNPIDAIPWFVNHFTPFGDEAPLEAWGKDVYPWFAFAMTEAFDKGQEPPEWKERLNEIPNEFMVDPSIGPLLKYTFGVERVELTKNQHISRATTFRNGKPARWVVGQRFEEQEDPWLAMSARLAWRAYVSMAGRTMRQAMAYGRASGAIESNDENLRTELDVMGAQQLDRLSPQGANEARRLKYIQAIGDRAQEKFGPKATQAGGVGSDLYKRQ
jgi:hypothetical protein